MAQRDGPAAALPEHEPARRPRGLGGRAEPIGAAGNTGGVRTVSDSRRSSKEMITATTTPEAAPAPDSVDAPPPASAPERDPRPEAGQSITLPVDGMSCAGCSAAVRSRLEELPGVIGANVNLATSKATVEYDPEPGGAAGAGGGDPVRRLRGPRGGARGRGRRGGRRGRERSGGAVRPGGVAGGAALPRDPAQVLVLDHLGGPRHGASRCRSWTVTARWPRRIR